MVGEQNIEVVRLHRFEGESKVKAFVDIGIGDFVVKGFRIVEGEDGLFLGLPQEQGKDGKWYNSFYTKTEEARQNLVNIALAAYKE